MFETQHKRGCLRQHVTRQLFKLWKAPYRNISGFSRITLAITEELFPVSMSQHTGYSPSFKRPAEIMRMRRKRARSDAGVLSLSSDLGSTGTSGQSESSPSCVRPFSPGPLFNTQNRPGGGLKRRNPFANIENTFSPKKKLVIFDDGENVDAAGFNKIKRPSEEDGDLSTKRDSRVFLPFSARLAEVEKREREDISGKVGRTI